MKQRILVMGLTAGVGRPVLIGLALVVCAGNTIRAEEKEDHDRPAMTQPVLHAPRSHGDFGVGAILGEPTGVSLKGWLNDKAAVDGAVAWSFDKHDSLQLHADYLYHNFDLLPVAKGSLALYFGVGGRVLFDDRKDDRFGIRGPIGLTYMFDKAPVDIFVEVAPIMDLAPSTKFDLNGGIGVRFYFK